MIKILGFLIALISFGVSQAQRVIVKGRKAGAVDKAVAQPGYSMDQLTGKWQEVKRSHTSHRVRVDFTDTLQLNFNKRDSVIVRDGITMSQRGFANVTANRLSVAGDSYSIKSLSKNSLVINDGEYLREFARRKNFHYEKMGKIVIPKENISDPVSVDLKKLSGKWYVYRTQSTPGVAEDSTIIKILNFTHANGDGPATGEVTFTRKARTQTLPFQATIGQGSISIVTSSHTWNLATYKADGTEFIFGNQGALVYFSKKL